MESAANPDDQASERIKPEPGKEEYKKQDQAKTQDKVVNADKSATGKPAVPTSKQQQRREGQSRRKDDKSVEHVLRALNSLNTPEEKLAAMCKKYADLVNDQRAMQNTARVAEKRISVLQREKEQLQGEQSKAVLVRSRLENLCRELQRQNKVIKEESAMRIREEEERRREVSAKFQMTLNEITAMMKQNSDKNSKLRDDNIDMTAKLKSVCQEFEKRELHVEQLVKQFQLEVQLADAKLTKAKMEMSSERETLIREKQQLLMEVVEYKTRLEQMQESELQLKTQMSVYNDKYEEFHKALIQSNQVISGFKTEIDKMSKQIRKLEKETCAWKTKYDETHTALLRMTDERVRGDEALERANRRVTTLHSLCRTLQGQIVEMRNASKTSTGGVPEKADSNGDITATLENPCDCRCEDMSTEAVNAISNASGSSKPKAKTPSASTKSAQAKRSSSPVSTSNSGDSIPNSTNDTSVIVQDKEEKLSVPVINESNNSVPPDNECEVKETLRLQETSNDPVSLSVTTPAIDSCRSQEVEEEEAREVNCHDLPVPNDSAIINNVQIDEAVNNKTDVDFSMSKETPSNQVKMAVASPQNKAKSSTPPGKGPKGNLGPSGRVKSKNKGSHSNPFNSAQADIKSLSQNMSQASLT